MTTSTGPTLAEVDPVFSRQRERTGWKFFWPPQKILKNEKNAPLASATGVEGDFFTIGWVAYLLLIRKVSVINLFMNWGQTRLLNSKTIDQDYSNLFVTYYSCSLWPSHLLPTPTPMVQHWLVHAAFFEFNQHRTPAATLALPLVLPLPLEYIAMLWNGGGGGRCPSVTIDQHWPLTLDVGRPLLQSHTYLSLLQLPPLNISQRCACFPEILQNFSERQILWSLCSIVFHALTSELPIQTPHSVAPELQVP